MDLANQAVDMLFCERFSFVRNVAAFVGTAFLLKMFIGDLLSLLNTFRAFFLAPWGISRLNLKKYGNWAIVTGASEGIGRGYALELARQGLNVAIMSRSEEKLNHVASTIRDRYNREVRVIPVDFNDGQSVYADIQAEISDLDVAVLVNNVGLSTQYPDYFNNVPENRHRDIVELNCQSMVQMTHLVLPKMVERGGGVIVNMSSASSLDPTPLLNVYGATKAFASHFSHALHYEYSDKGIVVQCVRPFFVATSMTKIRRPKWWAPHPDHYARSAVATIGIQRDTLGCLAHAFQGWVMSLFDIIPGLKARVVLNSMKQVRKQAIKKQQKKQ